MCVDGYACEDGVCAPALMCPGDIEPDDNDEETAKSFGDITDNDDDAFTISGILGGAEDTDWYTYHGKDTFGYIVEPKANLLAGGLRLCQFLVCDAGGAAQSEVTCPAGTKFAYLAEPAPRLLRRDHFPGHGSSTAPARTRARRSGFRARPAARRRLHRLRDQRSPSDKPRARAPHHQRSARLIGHLRGHPQRRAEQHPREGDDQRDAAVAEADDHARVDDAAPRRSSRRTS